MKSVILGIFAFIIATNCFAMKDGLYICDSSDDSNISYFINALNSCRVIIEGQKIIITKNVGVDVNDSQNADQSNWQYCTLRVEGKIKAVNKKIIRYKIDEVKVDPNFEEKKNSLGCSAFEADNFGRNYPGFFTNINYIEKDLLKFVK